MNVTDVIMVVSAVVNVLLLILVFKMHEDMNTIKLHVTQMHSGLAGIVNKLLTIEQTTIRLANGFTEMVNMTSDLVDKLEEGQMMQMGHIFRTMDGKFTAASMDELISKIKNSDNPDKYLSDDEVEKLKGMFEEDDDDDSFEEED